METEIGTPEMSGRYRKEQVDFDVPQVLAVRCPRCRQEIRSKPDEWMRCCCSWTAIEGGRVWSGMQVVEP